MLAERHLLISAACDLGLIELRAGSPLLVQLLPTGIPFAWRHESTLLNQVLPGPAENGLFRLVLRWRDASGAIIGSKSIVAPGERVGRTGPAGAAWICAPQPGLGCETQLQLHPTLPAWSWRVQLHNESPAPFSCDVLHAQDLGLADAGAVRNNEAYTSQYIDLLPQRDDVLGWTILARQNQPMAHGRRPWLAVGCAQGAPHFCTDGSQFFGADHRVTNEPVALRSPDLPSVRMQYEFALAGLQSRTLELAPGATAEVTFVARFLADHPVASSAADLALLHALLPCIDASTSPEDASITAPRSIPTSLFVTSAWAHGEAPTSADWNAWFPGSRRHKEFSPDGRLMSFFHGEATHVVARDKEAAVARPHGHILRSGESRWFDADHFGLTCYAAGIFSAQAYLGHPNFARLLSVVRNPLNVIRGSGQRVFVRSGDEWLQLGIPSAFAMTPGDVRWLYRLGSDVIEVRVWCLLHRAAACLELHVLSGPSRQFLVTHEIVLGASEFDQTGSIAIRAEAGYAICQPAGESLVGQHQPGVCFAIAAADPAHLEAFGGDELIYPDCVYRGGGYVVLRTRPVARTGILLFGTREGAPALTEMVSAVRTEFAREVAPAAPPAAPVRLRGDSDPAIARLDEALPWFTHNAAIHFSAPHGLEQYGGAAWGVRDVCQGSVEWLLAAGEFTVVRRILATVFAQQYSSDGSWPQWFMLPPYHFTQQAHSHGDVCFWPVKALCDYIEASNDVAFLRARSFYTDPEHFTPAGPEESLLEHCDRVVAHCEARFLPGTALVNYGDGDWDDTLQPADAAMRTHMASAWTVGLAFHTFRQLAEVCRRAGEANHAARLDELCARMRRDFAAHLILDGTVAGFLVTSPAGPWRPLLHPTDAVTHIRYRLLPMTRSILAELFTPDEARHHLDLIERELLFPDGVRLMSEPSTYRGGVERLFKRAETAANVGREIGLQYVHAHLRYAEALAKVGDAERLLTALQVVNPVDLTSVVPHAAPRQSNVYFSSSDADFPDRYEAAKRWSELHTGHVAVRGGWRLYSSGPGLFLHKVRACLLGVRESFDEIVFDPVLPRRLDGLVAETTLCGCVVELHYHVKNSSHSPTSLAVNGAALPHLGLDANPYRSGGLRISRSALAAALTAPMNRLDIEL